MTKILCFYSNNNRRENIVTKERVDPSSRGPQTENLCPALQDENEHAL